MCCLRYEHECYNEAIKRIPKLDCRVVTPEGDGVVVETNPLAGLVRVRLEKDQNKTIKLFKAEEVTKM